MENLTVKLFNEIAEKQLPGLALFENRTGSGKTTGALQWVTDMLMKSKNSDVIIYITPSRQNRDEAWRGLANQLEEKGKDKHFIEHNVILLKSEVDEVSDYLNKVFFKGLAPTDNDSISSRVTNFLSPFKHRYPLFAETLKKAMKRYQFYFFQKGLHFSQNKHIDDEDFSKAVSLLKKNLVRDIKKKSLSKKISNNDILEEITANISWVFKMFPELKLKEKRVVFMTSRKFLTLIKTPKVSTMHTWAAFSRKKVHLIMDEVDEIKEDWNNFIIDQITDKSDLAFKDRLDLFHIYRRIIIKVNDCMTTLPQQIIDVPGINGNNDNKDILKVMQQKMCDTYKNLNLLYRVKLDDSLRNGNQRFIFNIGMQNQLLGKTEAERYLVIQSDPKQQLNLIKSDKALYQHGELRLSQVLKHLQKLIRFFVKNAQKIGQNVTRAERKDWTANEATAYIIRSILDESNEEDKTTYILSRLEDGITGRFDLTTERLFGDNQSIYANGYEYLQIMSNDDKAFGDHVYWYHSNFSAERLLAFLANKWHVYGLSATAKSPTMLNNFDYQWVEAHVKNNYQLSTQLEKELDKENKDYLATERRAGINVSIRNVDLPIKGQDTIFAKDLLQRVLKVNRIPAELFTVYPEEEGLRPNDVISLAGDGQVSFTLLRNLKTVQVLITFAKFYNERPLNPAYVLFKNKKVSEELLHWYKLCLKAIGMGKVSLTVVDAQNAQQKIPLIKKDWTNGKLNIMVTTYAALGRGINLHYSIDAETLTELVKSKNGVIIGKQKQNLSKDIDGEYLEAPTHIATWIGRSDEQFLIKKMLHIIGEQDALYGNGHITRATYRKNLYAYINGGPVNNYRQNDMQPVKIAGGVYIEQALGRMARTNIKSSCPLILIDNAAKKNLVSDYLNNKRTTLEMAAVLADISEIEAELKKEKARPLYEKLNMANEIQYRFTVWLPSQLREDRQGTKEMWQRLREMILKYPFGDDASATIQRLHWQFEKAVNEYYFAIDGDYNRLLAIDTVPIQHYNQHQFDFVHYGKTLNRIYEANPWLKEELDLLGYYHDFEKPHYYQLLPGIFNNFYRPALSEEVFKVICKYLGIKVYSMADNEFELFDCYLQTKDKKKVFVDIKDYNEITNATEQAEVFKKARLKLANCTENNPVYFINFRQLKPNSKYEQKLFTLQSDQQFFTCPSMFLADGKLNSQFAKNLLDYFE